MAQSSAEAAFDVWLRQNPDIPEPEREYVFAPPRKWRFDFAWPEYKFAVEIEGVLYGEGGRHQRVDGFERDCEKYEAALRAGWRLYRIPSTWVQIGSRPIWRDEVGCCEGRSASTLPYLIFPGGMCL